MIVAAAGPVSTAMRMVSAASCIQDRERDPWEHVLMDLRIA
jgi:hypothetical protein